MEHCNSLQFQQLIKDLQLISSQEKNVRQKLIKTKRKIKESQELIEKLENRKKKLKEKKKKLEKERVDIIELTQNAVNATSDIKVQKKSDATLQFPSRRRRTVSKSSESSECSSKPTVRSPEFSIYPNTSTVHSKIKNESSPLPEFDGISWLAVKIEEPELIVIDGEDMDETSQNVGDFKQNEMFANIASFNKCNQYSENVLSVFDMKNLTPHLTIVNCLLVFEEHLYTCSNDSTAKRFKLKDPSETITYLHGDQNVTKIVVEKVQSEVLVFTSTSNRTISIFTASNGTRIKAYIQVCSIMSICKGWGKFYSGMADGSIHIYNWLYEEKKIIQSGHSASRIATAHQRLLNVLIILWSNGELSVNDAETGLFLSCIKEFVIIPSWLTVFNNLAYLRGSDNRLIIFNIMTESYEKYELVTNSITDLAVIEDYIFTISDTGLISCYNKENVIDKKVYYGAGKNGLTCIDVYKNWVFTGNRRGEINVFKFDTSGNFPCEFGQCSLKFGLKTDLAFHVEKDHLTKRISKCNWNLCNFRFSRDCTVEDKMLHLNMHAN